MGTTDLKPEPVRRVGIFRAELLPLSETFIRNQATTLVAWQPVLLGRRELAGSLQTPGVARELVPETRSSVVGALRFWLALPDPGLVARLKALQLDLVHAHFGTNATEAWPSVKAAGLPMLVTLHGFDINTHREWWESGHGGRRGRVYPRRLLAMARDPGVRFIAVSDAIHRRAIAYGIPEDKLSVAHIGVDTHQFSPGGLPIERRRKRILFVGRMVEKKAPLFMVRAFAAVRHHVRDAELVMVGDGPLLAAARHLASELDLPVVFAGAGTQDDVLAQLHEARVFCLPSVTALNGDAEGFGLVLLEAQAAGVPVVTSAVGGAEEGLRDGETGYACREGDLDGFVHHLTALLCDDPAAARASENAVRFARTAFDVRACSKTLESIYDRCTMSPDSQ